MAAARESADYVALDVSYVYEGLLAYKVEKVDDLHQLATEQRRADARSREDAKVKKFAEGSNGGPPRRLRSKTPKVRACKNNGTTDGYTSTASSNNDSDFADIANDIGAYDSNGQDLTDCIGGAGRDRGDEVQSPPAEIPPPPLPCRHDSSSGRVYGPDGAYWGRVSIVRPGQPSESISVYCSRHGCTICKRVSGNIPGHREILKWFMDGQSVPAGRASGLQSRHKQLWP